MRRLLQLLSIALLLVSIPGCGGGTIGTGPTEDSQHVSGKIVASDGSALENILVRTVGGDDTDTTDTDGRFEITTHSTNGRIDFIFEGAGIAASTSLHTASPTADSIAVIVTVNTTTSGAVASVEVTEVDIAPSQSLPSTQSTQRFLGHFKNGLGAPLQGVYVELERLGIHATSNKKGDLSLATRNRGGSFTFLVRYRNLKGTFTLKDIPSDRSATIKFTVQLAIEAAGIDPGTGAPHNVLSVQVTEKSVKKT